MAHQVLHDKLSIPSLCHATTNTAPFTVFAAKPDAHLDPISSCHSDKKRRLMALAARKRAWRHNQTLAQKKAQKIRDAARKRRVRENLTIEKLDALRRKDAARKALQRSRMKSSLQRIGITVNHCNVAVPIDRGASAMQPSASNTVQDSDPLRAQTQTDLHRTGISQTFPHFSPNTIESILN